jgi:hypothetical protein
LGSVGFIFQFSGQFQQKRFYPDYVLYGFEAHPISAGTTLVSTDKTPSMIEDIFSVYLVVEYVKAIGRFLLGLGIQLPL